MIKVNKLIGSMEADDDAVIRLPAPKTTPKQLFGDTLEVYVIPHSHDDFGWLRTPQELYDLSVGHILEHSVEALTQNPNLKFVQVETAFLEMWWARSNSTMKAKLRR